MKKTAYTVTITSISIRHSSYMDVNTVHVTKFELRAFKRLASQAKENLKPTSLLLVTKENSSRKQSGGSGERMGGRRVTVCISPSWKEGREKRTEPALL